MICDETAQRRLERLQYARAAVWGCVLAIVLSVVGVPVSGADDKKEPARQVPVETLEDADAPRRH